MQILVDADACPVVGIVESLAEKYNIPTTLLCDTNHVLYSDYSNVIIVGAGTDIKGPRKRIEEDDVRFAQSFEK